ncbi:hypothetical protein HMPREF9120_00280 [Neisseria sp. oral taxon 020 str. F0370]|nr:hypothetical protein HMPREF9120_00280 [Neisseria sp. oral taxon 020 str. F0370]
MFQVSPRGCFNPADACTVGGECRIRVSGLSPVRGMATAIKRQPESLFQLSGCLYRVRITLLRQRL